MDCRFNNSWVIWYHNPVNENWDIKSYENVFEINNLQDLSCFQNSKHLLPSLSTSMFFIMRKKTDVDYVYPMWEDDNNKKGGCWSFKIPNEKVEFIWRSFLIYLSGENLGNSLENSQQFNGVSFSPKNGFCIVKIWNKDSTITELEKVINPEVVTWLDVKDCFYKSHTDNILRDQKKRNYKKNLKQSFKNSNSNRGYKKKSEWNYSNSKKKTFWK